MISNKKEQPRYDTFDTVVRDICAYLNDPDATKKYAQVSRFLLRAMEDLKFQVVGNIKSVLLTIGNNLTAPLPEDYNVVSKIGVCCKSGQLRILHSNDKLCIPEEEVWTCCDCECPTSINDKNHKGCPSCTFHNMIDPTQLYSGIGTMATSDFLWFNGLFNYPYWYGSHSQSFSGTYRIDDYNNQIVFGTGTDICPGATVVMEYNSALKDSQYGFIEKKYFQVLLHKTATFLTKGGEQQLEQRNFRREKNNIRRMEQSVTLEDIVYYLQKGLSSAPRRG
jgi:hypothetical protein